MEKKLLNCWKEIIECNDNIIKTQDHIISTLFIVKKDYSMKIIGMIWRNPEEKDSMKEYVKKLILNEDILGYGVICDAFMTNMETKEVQEVVIRNFYTAKETISNFILHKGKEIIGEWKPESFKFDDSWNLWGNSEIDEKDKEKNEIAYEKFRQENPELYKEK